MDRVPLSPDGLSRRRRRADFTAFKTTIVPVGADQAPLIEQTNEILRRINAVTGAVALATPRSSAALRYPAGADRADPGATSGPGPSPRLRAVRHPRGNREGSPPVPRLRSARWWKVWDLFMLWTQPAGKGRRTPPHGYNGPLPWLV
ncbi:hypothetical protein FGD77_06040 [Roseovarius sp. M141]|nr:hypothetical protein [Roseovarius sp. M141]